VYRLAELAEHDGLADGAVGAEVVGGAEVFVFLAGREDENGNYAGPLVGADAAEDFEPVDLGQVQVEQDERRVAWSRWSSPRSMVRASAPSLARVTGLGMWCFRSARMVRPWSSGLSSMSMIGLVGMTCLSFTRCPPR
jgi:hypothetical protein